MKDKRAARQDGQPPDEGAAVDGRANGAPADQPHEPPADTITRPGDAWILAGHRLVCPERLDTLIELVVDAERDGRFACMLERDPRVWDLIIRGWEQVSGLTARRVERSAPPGRPNGASQRPAQPPPFLTPIS